MDHTDHLLRLTGWSLASLAAALLLLFRDRRSPYGWTTLAWALANYGTVLWAIVTPPPVFQGFRDGLVLNLGLDAVFLTGGIAMTRHRIPWIASAGLATLLQATGLALLNGWLYLRMP